MKAAISLLFFVTLVLAQSREFKEFQLTFNKIYKDENELQMRQKIFEQNKKIIDEHNERYAIGLETFEMGVNQFTDHASSEFQNSGNKRKFNRMNKDHFGFDSTESLYIPKYKNWVEEGAVTAVKDQRACNCSWAFAAVATLEGQYFLNTGQLVELSVQNLLDCSSYDVYGNRGCISGWVDGALQYVLDNDGIQTEETYKYEARDKRCRYNKLMRGAQIRSIRYVKANDERSLEAAVAIKGPVAVFFNASHLHQYKRGVYSIPCENGTEANHDATIVGYGHDSNGGDYWLVKNSWGKAWGENGYFRIARNKGNLCGIASEALFPIVH